MNDGQPVEAGGIPGRVDLQFEPAGPLGGVVGDGLVHQPPHVRGSSEHGPGDVVESLETEPAALVGAGQFGRPVLAKPAGEPDAAPVGEFDHRRVPHGPGEVQMQVRLRQGAQ